MTCVVHSIALEKGVLGKDKITGKKGQVTVVECASASVQILPPTIDAKNVDN